MSRHAADTGVLVGRASALEALQQRLEAALQGQGALVLIRGDAGIGKTSLALACGEKALALGAAFAVGRCYERGVAPPFSPWHDVLADLQTSTALDLAALPTPFGSGPSAQTAYQLMQAVAALLREVATARPLVLLLDDLHWADQETLELLDFVTRRLEHLPLLILVTYRSEEVHRDHPLYDFLPDLRRDRPIEIVRLGELSLADTALLVESYYERCSPELAAYLHARTDGHPLFLVELLRDLVEQQMLPQDDQGRWLPPAHTVPAPTRLQQVIRRRIARLGEEVEELLDIAAVVGQEWELAVVEAALGWPEEHLLRALEEALAAKVIVPATEGAERYRFAHAPIHEVLYGQQVARRRKHVHAHIGAILEELAPPSPGLAENLAALAYHFYTAEQWEKAAQYSLAAGDAARNRYASHSALLFYKQALAATHKVASAAGPDVLLKLYERLGQVHMVLNQKEQAEAVFTQMLEVARTSGDRLAEGRALSQLSHIHQWLYRFAEACATGDAALRVAEQAGDPQLLALTHLNLGHLDVISGELDRSYLHLEQVEELARDGGVHDVLSRCLQLLAYLAIWRGHYVRAELLASEALALARASHDALTLSGTCFCLGLARGELGHYERARQALQAGLDHAEESGERHYLVKLLNTMGWLYSELGDVEAALRWDKQALATSRSGDVDRNTEAECYSLLNLATDELHAGRLEAAEGYVGELESGLDRNEYSRFRYLNRYQLLQAEIALACGALDAALRWSEEAAGPATAKGMRKNQVKSWLLTGRALLALGRSKEAAALIEQAMTLADELAHGSLRWQARLWLGQAYTALRQPTTDLYRQAMDLITAIAAELDDERLRVCFLASPLVLELQAATSTAQAPGVEPASLASSYPAGLTAREVEVLRLVAQGATNLMIAQTLHISVKTVNAHMSSVLGKTQCTNRAAAATFASRHGLT